MTEVIYWAIFALFVGAFALFWVCVFCGRAATGAIILCAGSFYPGVWLVSAATNRFVRTSCDVRATLAESRHIAEGHVVDIEIEMPPHAFYDAPDGIELSCFGAVDGRVCEVREIESRRGFDALVRSVVVRAFVPHVGATSLRLDRIRFGERVYDLGGHRHVELVHHYAYE